MGEGYEEPVGKVPGADSLSPYLFLSWLMMETKVRIKLLTKKKEEVRLYHNGEARISYHLRRKATR